MDHNTLSADTGQTVGQIPAVVQTAETEEHRDARLASNQNSSTEKPHSVARPRLLAKASVRVPTETTEQREAKSY